MAWITKNSATMEIDRREAAYLTEAMKSKLTSEVLPRFPRKQAATLPALHEVQHEYGHIPYQAIEEIGSFLELAPSVVLDTATFYDEFFLRPRGKYLIWVCRSLSCEMMGQPALLDEVCAKLNVEPGETTDDGKFTVMMAECLGSCGTAPVALVDEDLHENLTYENFERILDSLA